MINTGKLAGKTLFITGGSRGIGKEIGLKAAKDGANVVIASKTAKPHPKLPGTIYTAAEEMEKAGGKALPCIVDVRDEGQVKSAVDAAVKQFGGIDILVNNASAISLTGTLKTEMSRYDLMHGINTRGTFLVSKTCLPHLKKGSNSHILNLSPPLSMRAIWFKNHVAYTIAKYGMSMCVLGMAAEFERDGIAVNALWPRTMIQTAAIEMLMGEASKQGSRKPQIVADAAYAIFCRDSRTATGNFYVDEDVLKAEGLGDEQLAQYSTIPGNKKLIMDHFLDDVIPGEIKPMHNFQQKRQMSTRASNIRGVEGVISTLNQKLTADIVNDTQAIYQFNITAGEHRQFYHIDLRNGSGRAGVGKCEDNPDTIFSMDVDNFNRLLSGNMKTPSAYMTGILKISGSMQKAMKLEKLFTTLMDK